MSNATDPPIRRVLVPLDGSQRVRGALPAATALARQADVPLELLTVQAGGDWERDLESLAEAIPLPRVDTALVSSGAPDEVIAVLAAAVPGTVVCMATRARSSLSEVLLGSVSARLVRRARDPVVLVGPRADPGDTIAGFDRLVVCLSGSRRAEAMLPLARRWARQLQTGIALVHGTTSEPPAADTATTIKRLGVLSTAVDPADPPVTWHVARGRSPAVGVSAHLQRPACSLVFVSVRRGARMERLLPGGFTAELAQHSPAPVTVITAAAAPVR